MHHREDGGVGADAERQRQDRDEAHHRRAKEEPRAVLEVREEGAHARA
jgi:hypothetical protein